MANTDYAKARATAKKIITNKGGNGTLVKKGTSGGYDNDGEVVADTPDTTIIGIVTPLLQYKAMEVDQVNVITGDCYVFFSSDTSPEIGMMITINSKEFRVVDIKSLTSVDDINVFNKLQLRK